MSNFTKSILYSTTVLAAGLVAIFAIYNNVTTSQDGTTVASIAPAAGDSSLGVNFGETIENATAAAQDLSSGAVEAVQTAATGASEAASAAMKTAKKATEGSAEALSDIATSAGDAISETVDQAVDAIAETVAPATEVEQVANTAVEDVAKEMAVDAIEPAAEGVKEAVDAGDTVKKAIDADDAVKEAIDATTDTVNDIMGH